MDRIILQDLEVWFRVGVPDEERAQPQRLLLSFELEHDVASAAESDDLKRTIDYGVLAQRATDYGTGRSWRLIETLALELAGWVLREFGPQRVTVEVKKFVLPRARYVSVRVTRP